MTTIKPVIEYDEQGNARAFVGREAVDVFACAVIASALRLYAKTGIKANRACTPRNMIAAAERHTGHKFKARDYIGAADALSARVQTEKARIAALNSAERDMDAGAREQFGDTVKGPAN